MLWQFDSVGEDLQLYWEVDVKRFVGVDKSKYRKVIENVYLKKSFAAQSEQKKVRNSAAALETICYGENVFKRGRASADAR